MELNHEFIRRIAIAQHAVNLSCAMCCASEPLNAIGLSQLHDGIEIFLQTAAEFLNVGKKKCDFIEYWDIINSALVDKKIGKKEAMKRLNQARVGFKHSGIIPSRTETVGFSVMASEFINDSIETIFDVNPITLDTSILVSDNEIREIILEAREKISEGDVENSMRNMAIAFSMAIDRCENRKRAEHPFRDTYNLRSSISSQIYQKRHQLSHQLKESQATKSICDLVSGVAMEIAEPITVIAYKIDYEQYISFKSSSPLVMRFLSGHYEANWPISQPEVTIDQAKEFLVFVTDCAIKLQ